MLPYTSSPFGRSTELEGRSKDRFEGYRRGGPPGGERPAQRKLKDGEEDMRAREPDSEGFVEHDGVKIHYEVHGDGGPTILLMPTWTIVHKQTWKMQIAYLARHHRVVTYDGPGNGRSDRTLRPEAYHHTTQVEYALRVLDATGTDRAVVGALSMAAQWVLELAADHPDRVLGIVTIAGSVPLRDADADADADGSGDDPFLGEPPDLPL